MPPQPPKLHQPPSPPLMPDRLRAYELVLAESHKVQLQILAALEWLIAREQERPTVVPPMRERADSSHEWTRDLEMLDDVLRRGVKDPGSKMDSTRAKAIAEDAVKSALDARELTGLRAVKAWIGKRSLAALGAVLLVAATHLVRNWLERR